MLLSTLTITFIAPNLPAEAEVELLVQTLDIELQEAGLGTVTGSEREIASLSIRAEVNDEAKALTLVRTLLRSLNAPPGTRLEVRQDGGEARTLTVDE